MNLKQYQIKDEYKNTIYVGNSDKTKWTSDDKILYKVNYLNGEEAMGIVKLD